MLRSRFPRRATRKAQSIIEKDIARVFRRTKKEVVRQVRGKLGKMTKDDPIVPPDQTPQPQAASSAWAEAKAGSIAAAIDLSSLDDIIDTTSEQLASVMADAGEEGLKQVVEEDAYRNLVDQVNQKAVYAAKQRAAELVGKRVLDDGTIIDNPNAEWRIDQPTRDAIRKTIQDGLADNIGSQGIIDNLESDYAFSEERAELIARTEIANANSLGALDGYRAARDIGVKIKKAWQADDEACDICMENEAEGAIELDDEFDSGDLAPTAHPNCFVAGTLINSPSLITSHQKRWFSGEIIVIGGAGINKISVTPNHPVLTNRGWVAARCIKIGDYLVKCGHGFFNAASTIYPDYNNMPTSIEKIADALLMSGGMSTATVKTSAVDFHGDGIVDGQVDIIYAAGFLSDDIKSGLPQKHFVQNFISRSAIMGAVLNRLGASASFLEGNLTAAHGIVGSGSLHSALLRRKGAVHKESSLTMAADRISGFTEMPPQSQTMNPDHSSDFSARLAAEVEFIEVVNIERRNFAGHVYNLSTVNGWYIAENIIVSNCECALLPVVEEE